MGKFYTIRRKTLSPKMTREQVIESIYKRGVHPVQWIHDENRRNIQNWELLFIWKAVDAKKTAKQEKPI